MREEPFNLRPLFYTSVEKNVIKRLLDCCVSHINRRRSFPPLCIILVLRVNECRVPLCFICELRGHYFKSPTFSSTRRFLLNYHDKVEITFDL